MSRVDQPWRKLGFTSCLYATGKQQYRSEQQDGRYF
jgi:hypothetical protein